MRSFRINDKKFYEKFVDLLVEVVSCMKILRVEESANVKYRIYCYMIALSQVLF